MDTHKYHKINRVFPKVSSCIWNLTLLKSACYYPTKIKPHFDFDSSPFSFGEVARSWSNLQLLGLFVFAFNQKKPSLPGYINRLGKVGLPARRLVVKTAILALENKKNHCFFSKYLVIIKTKLKKIKDGNIFRFFKFPCKEFFKTLDKKIQTFCSPITEIFLSLLGKPLISLFFVLSFLNVLIFLSNVCAETVSYESALVWRVDDKGDFALPQVAPNSVYVNDPGVVTKGTIQSITATWSAEGVLTLEVSADDGLHYTAVRNGEPLLKNFTPGNILKWRAKAGPDSRLTEVRVNYHDSSGVAGSFGTPELSGFQSRRSIRIAGLNTGILLNHQVKIKLSEPIGTMAVFDDIRFTLPDGQTLLPYHLENITGEKPNRTAEFFVKVPEIPVEGINLYVYYGNPEAQSLSDPEATFDFYDDFSRHAVDTKKWQTRLSPGGSIALSGDGLMLDAASVFSRSLQLSDGVIEYSATPETGYETRLVIRDIDPDSESDINQVAYSSPYEGAEHCIAVGGIVQANDAKRIAAVTRYDYRVMVEAQNITFERFSPGFEEKQASVSYNDSKGPKKGFVGVKTAGTGRGRSITKFHWIRVRKLAQSEMAVGENSIGPREAVDMPVFVHTTVAQNGDLVLAGGHREGSWRPAAFSASGDIRALSPSWQGSGVFIDASGINLKTGDISQTPSLRFLTLNIQEAAHENK